MSTDRRVTVSLMTRNRAHYLRQALSSILAQTGVDLEVVVFDNASTDDTPQVIRSFNDPRIVHLPTESDIGIMRNWNRAIDVGRTRSGFVSVFHDDDIMLPGFLAESVQALAEHPSAGICLSLTEFIDEHGVPRGMPDHDLKPGLNKSLDFLEMIVRGQAMLIYPPMGIFRSDVLERIGPADSPHTRATCDMNHWHRAAADSDVYVLHKVLSQYRLHAGTDTHLLQETIQIKALGWYGVMSERADLIAHLLTSDRAADPQYRRWLADRLLWLHTLQSESLHQMSEKIYHTTENRLAMLMLWLDKTLPPKQPFILVDDAQLGIRGELQGRRVVPFLERDGVYWGSPNDSPHAIEELERVRQTGVRWLVITWPCRWWLEVYEPFDQYLRSRYRLAARMPHGLIFDLHGDEGGA